MSYLIWLSILAGAGLLLLVLGLRGRRVGNTPYCRRCGYDLSGIARHGRCPECGVDLFWRRNVVRGRQPLRRRLVAFNVAISLIALLLLIVVTVAAVARIDPYQIAPTGWIIARLADPARDAAALQELGRRNQRGRLRTSELQRIFDEVAERSRDSVLSSDARLDPHVSALLLSAIEHGELPSERISALLKDLLDFEFRCPPRVAVGQPLEYLAYIRLPAVLEGATTDRIRILYEIRAIRVPEVQYTHLPDISGGILRLAETTEEGNGPPIQRGSSGRVVFVELEAEFKAYCRTTATGEFSSESIASWNVSASIPIEVVASVGDLVTCVGTRDPETDIWFIKNLIVARPMHNPMETRGNIRFDVEVAAEAPLPFSAVVEHLTDAGWLELGEVQVPAHSTAFVQSFSAPRDETVDRLGLYLRVRCRGSPWRVAEGAEPGWGGTVYFEMVKPAAPCPRCNRVHEDRSRFNVFRGSALGE